MEKFMVLGKKLRRLFLITSRYFTIGNVVIPTSAILAQRSMKKRVWLSFLHGKINKEKQKALGALERKLTSILTGKFSGKVVSLKR